MPAFTREQLESYRDGTVPDLVGDRCRLLFVGINPGLWTVATQTHFCHPSNRFYPALKKADLIDFDVDASTGMTDAQRDEFVIGGLGITNIVQRATARASELSSDELRSGGRRLEEFVGEVSPDVVAIAGITAFRSAFRIPKAVMGSQEQRIADAVTYVVPNPSGLNAHETVESLAQWYRRAAASAGL